MAERLDEHFRGDTLDPGGPPVVPELVVARVTRRPL
jgi:hypothetical protein